MLHLAEFAASLRTLGSYPRWRRTEPGGEDPARTAEPVREAGAQAAPDDDNDGARQVPQEGAHRG